MCLHIHYVSRSYCMTVHFLFTYMCTSKLNVHRHCWGLHVYVSLQTIVSVEYSADIQTVSQRGVKEGSGRKEIEVHGNDHPPGHLRASRQLSLPDRSWKLCLLCQCTPQRSLTYITTDAVGPHPNLDATLCVVFGGRYCFSEDCPLNFTMASSIQHLRWGEWWERKDLPHSLNHGTHLA